LGCTLCTVSVVEHGLALVGHAYLAAIDYLEVKVGLAGQALLFDAFLTIIVVEQSITPVSGTHQVRVDSY